MDVSIFRPLEFPKVATTAALAASVRPEHVTVTEPAGSELVTTSVIFSLLNDEVDVTAALVTAHKLAF